VEEIDQINILKASHLAMHRAVEALHIRPEWLLIDGNRFTPFLGIPHTCFVKGDATFAPIAAAAILAKTYRDDCTLQLAEAFPQYGWHTNKGYPSPHHKRMLLEHGPSPHHRLSYKPVQLAMR
jgi:ribonuclease HII